MSLHSNNKQLEKHFKSFKNTIYNCILSTLLSSQLLSFSFSAFTFFHFRFLFVCTTEWLDNGIATVDAVVPRSAGQKGIACARVGGSTYDPHEDNILAWNRHWYFKFSPRDTNK